MTSFGHVRDMMERYAHNRELLLNKRQRHARTKEAHSKSAYKLHRTEKDGSPIHIDKKALQKIKIRIRREKLIERWAFIAIGLVVVIFVVWAFGG